MERNQWQWRVRTKNRRRGTHNRANIQRNGAIAARWRPLTGTWNQMRIAKRQLYIVNWNFIFQCHYPLHVMQLNVHSQYEAIERRRERETVAARERSDKVKRKKKVKRWYLISVALRTSTNFFFVFANTCTRHDNWVLLSVTWLEK